MPSITDVEETGKLNLHIVLQVVLIIIGLIVLTAFNIVTSAGLEASIFLQIGYLSLFGMLAAIGIKFTKLNVDILLVEKPIFRLDRRIIVGLSIFMGIGTFFTVTLLPLKISAPSFQVVDLGFNGNFSLDFFAAIYENILFFALIPGLSLVLLSFLVKDKGLFAKIIIVGLTFLISVFSVWFYHLNAYGFGDVVGQTAVIAFAIEMTAWMLVFRDINYVHARHIGNNLGLIVARQVGFAGFFIGIFSNIVTYIVIVLIIIILLLRRRAK